MSEIERLMPVSYRRLLELQQLVEAYGKGDTTVMSQIIGLQVNMVIVWIWLEYVFCCQANVINLSTFKTEWFNVKVYRFKNNVFITSQTWTNMWFLLRSQLIITGAFAILMTKLNKYLKYIYCFRNSCQETARDWIYLLERNLLTVDITPSTGTFSRYTLYCCLFHVLWDLLDLCCGSKTSSENYILGLCLNNLSFVRWSLIGIRKSCSDKDFIGRLSSKITWFPDTTS